MRQQQLRAAGRRYQAWGRYTGAGVGLPRLDWLSVASDTLTTVRHARRRSNIGMTLEDDRMMLSLPVHKFKRV